MILCYHAVNPEWRDYLSVHPRDFVRHAAWLSRRRVGTVTQAWQSGAGRSRVLALTFDDGFADLYAHAFPVLRAAGLPATVYLVAGTLVDGQAVDWVDTAPEGEPLATLSLDQILEMQEGGVAFGSHTWSHPDLTTVDDAGLDRELGRSREALEDLLGRPVPTLAYPRGRHDERVRRAAERAGYELALSLPSGPEHTSRLAVPRVGVAGGDSTRALGVKARPAYLRLRTSRIEPAVVRAGSLARRARAAAGRG